MLGSRRGRPSLIGRAAQTAARTAVIAATANAVTNKMAPRPAPGAAPAAPVPDAAPAPAAPAAMSDEAIVRLKQLADLHAAGVLSAEEFAEQKARLLA